MKEFLHARGVPYVEKYVDQDRGAAIEMIRRSGQQGVPQTLIGDELIVGFDQPRLERAIAKLAAKKSAAGNARKPLGAKVADAARYASPAGTMIEGAYVGGVNVGSPAEAAGMRAGDVIVSVGDTPVRSAEELSAALKKLSTNAVSVAIVRGSQRMTLAVDL